MRIIHRFGEASTWAGLAAAAGTASATVPPEFKTALWIATGICSALAVLLREGSN